MILHCEGCGYEGEYDSEEQARDCNWWQDDNGSWYCEECHGYCADCDEHYPSSELTWVESRDGDVCQGCLDDDYFRCDHCGEYYHNDYWCTVYNRGVEEHWCDNCLNRQRDNGNIRQDGDYTIYEESNRMPGGHIYQPTLHPEVWNEIRTCPECLERRSKCPKCLRKEAAEIEAEETTLWVYDTRAMGYHNSDHHHFKETKYRDKHEHPYLYYGVENELLFNSNAPIDQITKEYIEATNGLFVAEYDRSVTERGNGIEFISRPLSFKKWMSEEVYQLLEAGNEVLKKYKAFIPQPDACGLHVHMSLKFFERNTEKKVKDIKSDIDWMFQVFQPQIEQISRREYTRYCASKAYRLREVMKQIRGGYGFNLEPLMTLQKGNLTQSMGSGDTHHDAIIQTNRTIEVRTFRATTITEELLATIEFCRAIAHASRNMKLTTKNTLADVIYCKDSKYLQPYIERLKVDTKVKFANKLEVKI